MIITNYSKMQSNLKSLPEFSFYLLMVSYKREDFAVEIIEDFLSATHPVPNTNFIVVENSPSQKLNLRFNFDDHKNIIYSYFSSKNKAAAINFALHKVIIEEEAFIICIDNDVRFEKDYLLKFYNTAKRKGNKYYFGTSFFVKKPMDLDEKMIPYLSGSALGQPDLQFKKMKKLMFLGFSYGFFKSQWEKVGGLDERFSPGSVHDLAAEESIFQKKLKHAGFTPFFIENNVVEHKPEFELYSIRKVLFRQF